MDQGGDISKKIILVGLCFSMFGVTIGRIWYVRYVLSVTCMIWWAFLSFKCWPQKRLQRISTRIESDPAYILTNLFHGKQRVTTRLSLGSGCTNHCLYVRVRQTPQHLFKCFKHFRLEKVCLNKHPFVHACACRICRSRVWCCLDPSQRNKPYSFWYHCWPFATEWT